MVGLAVLEAGHPVARAAMLGVVGTAAAGSLLFGLVLADGTLLARLGRMAEEAVGDELRGTPGVYGVVSNLPFACSDVDHVVLAPAGVLAVEVKQIHGLRRGVSADRWSGMLEQARTGARRTTVLLHQHGLDLQAWPVLVVAGAGAPELPGGRQVIDGVTVVSWRDSDSWRPRLAARQHLDVATAPRPRRRRPAGLPHPALATRPRGGVTGQMRTLKGDLRAVPVGPRSSGRRSEPVLRDGATCSFS